MISIFHVCPRQSYSGLEAYALAMAKGQSDLGHQVRMAVLADSPLSEKCRSVGVSTVEISPNAKGRLRFVRETMRILNSSDAPDIVHLHSTQDLNILLAPLAAMHFGRRKRALVVLQTHIWISHTKRDPLHAMAYRFVDEVWCSSEPARETLKKFLPIPEGKIRVVNYGREVTKMSSAFQTREEARRALGLPDQAIVVGAVARIDEGKGTREFFEAAVPLMRDNLDIHLIWIGPPTADDPKAVSYSRHLNEWIAALPSDHRSRIHIPGAVPDSFRLMKAFDLFVLPTYKECFSLSLLEAMLAGLPCLATNAGGSPEVIRDGETGWLFEPRSAESLRQTLTRALNERATWQKLSRNAEARIRSDFDFSRILPKTVEAYQEVLTLASPRDLD